ncbi:viral A-type inclusion protein repeat-containing domain protein [Teladorsagia circumcincta]|uniref:Viral A-type inclusion protein repeat-containing domain protein n=1 Tax=Teladorsagia circumcincta TaxID=45464 RepID=A0A2G9V5L2_TELCI|nr:viral A-type inclusion protein repeat-containing domain protein [Teladorsagia circumcincta]
MKRDRIVDNAKKYVALDEEIYNNLTNTCIAGSNAEGRGDEEEQSVIEILFDELVGRDRIDNYATPDGDDSDGNSAAVEWTTASSSEPWDHEANSEPKVASLEKRQQELNELLISERNNYEGKLSCLRSVMEEDKERADALQLSLDELNEKHQEAVAELQRMQSKYSGVVEELGTERAENVRLSDLARCAELETRQIKELARDIEEERSSLRLENIEYAEKVRNLENNISTLQASESGHKKRCEELTQLCESLEASFSKEREDFTQQLELLQKTLEEDSESNDSTSKEKFESEKQRHEMVKRELEEQLSSLKESCESLKQQNEETCEHLAQVKSELSFANEDLDSTKEELKLAAASVAELQSSLATAQMGILTFKEENALLATKVCECEEIIRSTEQDLEETRAAYARQKEENDHHKAQNARLEKKLEELNIVANEINVLQERLAAAGSELIESTELNSHLHSQIAEYESKHSELSEELSMKSQRISELEEVIRDAENSSADIREQSAMEIAKLKEELTEAKALSDKLTCQLEVNSRAIPVEEFEKQMTAVQSSVKLSEDNLKLVKEERDRVVDELSKAKEQLREFEHDLSDALERCEVLTEGFTAERKKLKDELETVKRSEESLVRELWKAEEERAAKSAIHEQVQEKMTTLFNESQSLSLKLVEVKAQNEELLKGRELAEEQSKMLRSEVRSVRDDLVAACGQRDALLTEVSELDAANKELHDRLLVFASIEERCFSLEAALEKSQKCADEANALKEKLVSKDADMDILREKTQMMEDELLVAGAEAEKLREEVESLTQAVSARDSSLARLVEELERALFEKEQTLIMAGEGRDAAARVIALERNITKLKSEYDEKMKQMESLRKRLELAVQEIESLTRSNEEVRHLEAALEKSRIEKSTLYDELSSQRSMLDRVLAEKDALLAQLTALNGQLDERTNRLRQAGEAKMDTTLRQVIKRCSRVEFKHNVRNIFRIVELESQITALLRERDKIVEQDPETPSCSGLEENRSAFRMIPTEHVAVQIENEAEHAEIERLRSDLQRAEQRIAELEEFERSVGDSHRLLPEAQRSSDHADFFEVSLTPF